MGKLVTVFGGAGFLGRYVVQELLAQGARVRVAVPNPATAGRVKPLGDLGQVQIVGADIRKPETVAAALAGSDAVINLVGVLKGDFAGLHVKGAANIARAAAQAGASALVQVSAIGADCASPSAYGRSKGEGEQAVRAAFAHATIIRPSILFGREDQFTNRFAALMGMGPVVPVIAGETRFQPAYVVDVARAIAMAALDPARFGGKTFELGGPQQLSMSEINTWIAQATGRNPTFLPVPAFVACGLSMLPGGPITRDQLKMLQKDNVVAAGAEGFAAFGISPAPMAAVAESWMVPHRKHGRFTAKGKM